MIDTLVVHCSDSPFGCVDVIDGWHRAPPRKYVCIGYHYVIGNGFPYSTKDGYQIDWDGFLETGREEHVQGAHVRGHNQTSIGICCIGGQSYGDWLTQAQNDTLIKLLAHLTMKYPGARIVGHTELNPGKPCPNLFMDGIRDQASERIHNYA